MKRSYLAELIDKARLALDPSLHTRTAAALTELMSAVKIEFRVQFKKRQTPRRALTNKICYLMRKAARLESELASHKSSKTKDGAVSKE